jgi:hypothetical protein
VWEYGLDSAYGPVASFCIDDNEPEVSIKGGKHLD